MDKERPFVSILMALYNPNIEWLREVLISVEEQTYPNIEILIQDDCSDYKYIEEIKNSIQGKKRTMILERNSLNMGSDYTYWLLMKKARGTYIAFCDQDDRWDLNKIESLIKILESKKQVMLVYSDMRVMNENGKILYPSLKNYRKRLHFLYGNQLLKEYFFRNCTAGCSMVVKREVIERISRIPSGTYWDHWVCIVASVMGEIQFESIPRMSYRIHSNNQSGIFAHIWCKEDYYRLRVEPLKERIKELKAICFNFSAVESYLKQKEYAGIEQCVDARCSKNLFKIWKNRNFCKKEAWFEMALPFMTDKVFQFIVEKIIKA